MNYLKVWTNFRDVIQPLDDSEKGRLFDAMLLYAETGEEPEVFTGNERVIWPVAKRDIDMAMQWRETCKVNGSKGGRPKTKQNPLKPIKTQQNPNEPKETLKEKKGNENKRNEMKSSFMDDDEAREIQHEHDLILEAAKNAGFKCTPSEVADLIRLYAEHGLQKMQEAFTACVEHSAPNLAYLRAVLNGTGKKKPQMKVLPAQDFPQRDYSGVQGDMMNSLAKEIEAMRAGEAG